MEYVQECGSRNDVQEPAKGRLVNEILTASITQILKIASCLSTMGNTSSTPNDVQDIRKFSHSHQHAVKAQKYGT